MVEKVLKILEEEIVAAEGCTEPIAIAYLASKCVSIIGGIPEKLELELSGNIIKNVQSVKIPNSDGMVGIEAAAALGMILGDCSKELMVISSVNEHKLPVVQKYLDEDRISIKKIEHETAKLHLIATAYLGSDKVMVEIKHYHTNIVKIEKNSKPVPNSLLCDAMGASDTMTNTDFLTVALIYDLAKTIELEKIAPLFEKVITYNSAIANEGLKNTYGAAVGKTLAQGMKEGVYGRDVKNKIMSFTSAGSDARMNGCSLPVMTTSGSGNQGMTASLPIIKYCEENNISHEKLIRALFLSHLTTIHIKSNIGRLSAYCGVVCSGGGVAAALSFLDDLSLEQIETSIETTLATLSGMICDGAKSSCAAKISASAAMAFDAYYMSKKHTNFKQGEGIVGKNVEGTLKNINVLAHKGLEETDEVILDVILKNK